MAEPRTCDLCGLDVGARPFRLEGGRRLQFCCEGCRGIYQLLHDGESEAQAPPAWRPQSPVVEESMES